MEGKEMYDGSACFLVKDEDIAKGWESDFFKWLYERGFSPWGRKGTYIGVTWVFVNINNKLFAPGMPGVQIAQPISGHSVTIDEFKEIYSILGRDYDKQLILTKEIGSNNEKMERRILTAESVTSGHPDKLADLIADSFLDACLRDDENSRVACEVLLSNKNVFVVGEITTKADVKYENIVRNVIQSVGYETKGLKIQISIHEQSEDIAQAVDKEEQGAGDQGIVYGYATDETKNFMPLCVDLAHKLTDRLTECREQGIIKGLLPDGKSQVSLQYTNDKLEKVVSVLVSAQHEDGKVLSELQQEIKENVIQYVFREYVIDKDTEILINPSGRFVLGGFEADSGLTGRKLMVDSYGGIAHHGGGAYSGKDASKVDRSGAYFARYVAKNIVASGLAEKCEVAISYAIGKAEPTSVDVNTFYTGVVNDELIKKAVLKVFDFRPAKIIKKLKLKAPVYAKTAVGGHFGKDCFTWEKIDKAEELKREVFKD